MYYYIFHWQFKDSSTLSALLLSPAHIISDGDGVCELVIGYSDRRVRSYRWKEVGDFMSTPDITPGTPNGKFVAVENWQLDGQVRYCFLRLSNTVFILINPHILINAHLPLFENGTHDHVHHMISKKSTLLSAHPPCNLRGYSN